VRMFHGGLVNNNGEFKGMEDEVLVFERAPSLDAIVERVRLKLKCGGIGM